MILNGCSTTRITNGNTYWVRLDASQRGVIIKYDNGYVNICAEPSPDVVKELTTELLAKATVKAQGGEISSKTVQEAVQLAGRTQSILFLRESLYRLCEASMNGKIDKKDTATIFKEIINASIRLSQVELVDKLGKLDPATVDSVKESLQPPTNQLELPFQTGD